MVCSVAFLYSVHAVSFFIMQVIHFVCRFKSIKVFMVVVDQLWSSVGCLLYLVV